MAHVDSPIPVVFQVRRQSTRCPDKCYRPFYDGRSITDLVLEKYAGRPQTYLAAHEPEFEPIAKNHGIDFIFRDDSSAAGETVAEVMNYRHELPGESICIVNVCAPFLKRGSVEAALEQHQRDTAPTRVAICPIKDIILDEHKIPVNKDAAVFNSKLRKALYLRTGCFTIFSKERVDAIGKYFDRYREGDPTFHEIEHLETLDIDTEDQFCITQAVYAYYAQKEPDRINQ